MSFDLSQFQILSEKYPKWVDLKKYIESEDGGSFIVSDECNDNVIIHYDKKNSNMNLPHSKWFRSVVWDVQQNIPVCIAPPKVMDISMPYGTTGDVWDKMTANEFLDGVMINVFYTSKSDEVHIVSRSKFNAAGKYYSHYKLCNMFKDAISDEELNRIMEIPNKGEGEASTFVSFLLQHPEHRVVQKVESPRAYIVHTGTVYQDGRVTIYENPIHWTVDSLKYAIPKIERPCEDIQLNTWFVGESEKRGWTWQGVTFKDNHGNRWRMRSNSYNLVRSLRGDSSRSDVRFMRLRSQKLIDTYLFYYPEDSNVFWKFEKQLRGLTLGLYNRYVVAFITHTKKYEHIEKQFQPHLYTLHQLYVEKLKESGEYVRLKTVINYVNGLPWQRVLFLMNYSKRKGDIQTGSE
jgi:hypothetical protein